MTAAATAAAAAAPSAASVDPVWHRRHDVFNLLALPLVVASNACYLGMVLYRYFILAPTDTHTDTHTDTDSTDTHTDTDSTDTHTDTDSVCSMDGRIASAHWVMLCVFALYLLCDMLWLLLCPQSVPSPRLIGRDVGTAANAANDTDTDTADTDTDTTAIDVTIDTAPTDTDTADTDTDTDTTDTDTAITITTTTKTNKHYYHYHYPYCRSAPRGVSGGLAVPPARPPHGALGGGRRQRRAQHLLPHRPPQRRPPRLAGRRLRAHVGAAPPGGVSVAGGGVLCFLLAAHAFPRGRECVHRLLLLPAAALAAQPQVERGPVPQGRRLLRQAGAGRGRGRGGGGQGE
jgi:hypothetical protein